MTQDEIVTDFFEPISTAAQNVDDYSAEIDDRVVEQIESLCMNCHEDVRSYLVLSLQLTLQIHRRCSSNIHDK